MRTSVGIVGLVWLGLWGCGDAEDVGDPCEGLEQADCDADARCASVISRQVRELNDTCVEKEATFYACVEDDPCQVGHFQCSEDGDQIYLDYACYSVPGYMLCENQPQWQNEPISCP